MNIERIPMPLHLVELVVRLAAKARVERRRKLQDVMAVLVDGQECVRFRLTKNMWGIVDMVDAEIALSRCCLAHIKKNGERTKLYLHRAILPSEHDVDHENRDGLDNRRCNLRPATRAQNLARRRIYTPPISGFRGVYPARNGQFVARLHGRYLRLCKTAQEAALVYNAAALAEYGNFATLNTISADI
jgi:hypothetical protein